MEEAMHSVVADRHKTGRNAKQPELTRRDLLAASALGLIAGVPGLAQAAGPQGS
jgi:hypothetical protein